jgi:hypothetical protein
MFNIYNNMLYRLVEHYDIDNDYIDSSNSNITDEKLIETKIANECFICLETNLSNELPIKLKNQILYFNICVCDGYIHNSCLKKWYTRQSTCPICRIYATEIPSLKTIAITYFMNNKAISFICIKTNQIYFLLTRNFIIKSVIHFVSIFTGMFILVLIYSEIICFLLNKINTT